MSDDATDADRLHERLRAVERALTGDDRSVAELHEEATATAERETLDERLTEIETRVEELEAATQAVRGYVGSIRAVNREVERRADLALARATDRRDEEGDRSGRDEEGDRGGSRDRAQEGQLPTEADPAVTAAVPDGTTGTTSVDVDALCTDDHGDDVRAVLGDDPVDDESSSPPVHDDPPSTSVRDDDAGSDPRSSDTGRDRDVVARLREVL